MHLVDRWTTTSALVANLVTLVVTLVVAFGLWRRNRVALVVALVLTAWAMLSGFGTPRPGVNMPAAVAGCGRHRSAVAAVVQGVVQSP